MWIKAFLDLNPQLLTIDRHPLSHLILHTMVTTNRVNRGTLPLQNGTENRVMFSFSLMFSDVEIGFSFTKNVWT